MILTSSDRTTTATCTVDSNGKVEWEGTEVSSEETQKIALVKVNDESSAKNATVGEEVKIGNEHFFFFFSDDTTLTLLAKYNLATTPNESTGKYEQLNANFGITACRFSNNNYWSSDWVSETKINLNIWDVPEEKTMPDTETVSNNAILKSRKYGSDLGIAGKLLTYDEANERDTINCLFQTSVMQIILYGKYQGDSRVGGETGNGMLLFWLGSTYESSVYHVYYQDGDDGMGRGIASSGVSGLSRYGVRPVLEISKDKIE